MNISRPTFKKYIEDTVATSRYSSASEVVREGLRKLEERERWRISINDGLKKGLEDLAAGRIVG